MKQELEWRQARDLLLAETEPAGEEQLPLEEAAGRRLARPQWAGYDMPPFDRSPYDGYAFQSGDTMGALPVILRVIEEVPAGTVPKQVVTAGTAVKVLTGAPIPPAPMRLQSLRRQSSRPHRSPCAAVITLGKI